MIHIFSDAWGTASEDARHTATTGGSVSNAIHQAMAQIADGRPDDAMETVDEVNKQLGGKNPDLLSVRARALATVEDRAPNLVRKAFGLAYDAGQRKEAFFDHWYRAEAKMLNWDGAIQVIDRALQGDVEKSGFWILKRLDARFEAASRQKTSDVEHAVNQAKAGMRDFRSVAKCSDLNTTVDHIRIRRGLERFGDLRWDIPRNSGNFGQWLEALEGQLELANTGDKRYETYIRAAVAFLCLRSAPYKDAPKGLVSAKLRELLIAFDSAPNTVRLMAQFKTAHAEIRGISGV